MPRMCVGLSSVGVGAISVAHISRYEGAQRGAATLRFTGGALLAAVPNEDQMDEEAIAAAQRLADAGAEGLRRRG